MERTFRDLARRLDELVPGLVIEPRFTARASGPGRPREVRVGAVDRRRAGAFLVPRRDGWRCEVWMPRTQIMSDDHSVARRGGRADDTYTYARIPVPVEADTEHVARLIASGIRACRPTPTI